MRGKLQQVQNLRTDFFLKECKGQNIIVLVIIILLETMCAKKFGINSTEYFTSCMCNIYLHFRFVL